MIKTIYMVNIVSIGSGVSSLIFMSFAMYILYAYYGLYILNNDAIILIKFSLLFAFIAIILTFIGDKFEK
jgi:hypothetical protein